MSTKNTTVFVIAIIALAALVSLLLWNKLPDPMASHWGVNDLVNGTTSKFWGAFLMPIMSAAMFLLFLTIPAIDPLKANIAKFRESFNAFIVLITVFMVYIHGLTLAWNLGYTGFRMSAALLPALGLLFIFVGFMISKAKRNFFIGIRTPWTLSSDAVWDETHRVGAQLFKISGVLALVGAFFPDYAIWFLLVPVIGASLFCVVYSYILFQRETKTA
ncbi:MAG: SdpI family protein [Anaerolineales bacterium]